MEKDAIKKDMTIGEVIRKYPGIEKVFDEVLEYGCKECPEADNETIEFSANMLGYDADEIVRILNERLSSCLEK